MSIEKTTPRSPSSGQGDRKFNVDKSGQSSLPFVKEIDVSTLQIDDSLDADCDPYNRTGQFLIQGLKKDRSND
jgi:hypothetical protein